MRVVKGIVLLRTGSEIAQSSITGRIPATQDPAGIPEIGYPEDPISFDHGPRAERRAQENSSNAEAADPGCEDWT